MAITTRDQYNAAVVAVLTRAFSSGNADDVTHLEADFRRLIGHLHRSTTTRDEADAIEMFLGVIADSYGFTSAVDFAKKFAREGGIDAPVTKRDPPQAEVR